jgi:DNA-binding transcriptional LysR family regulator
MENLSLLRLFVQVAEAESFSATSRQLHTTPSAVSRQIARLEEELGARLVQRTTRQQSLTEAGEVLLQRARRILEEVDAAQLAVARSSKAPSGVLRLTAEADLAVTLLSPLMPDFLALYPDLRLQLFPSAALEDLIDRGIDVAIRVGHLQDSSLIARPLAQSRSVLLASPQFLAQHGVPQHPAELSDFSCLSFRVGSGHSLWRFRAGSDSVEVPVKGRIHAASLGVLKEAAISGLGIAMLPSWMVRAELDRESLVPVLPAYPLDPPSTPISALYPSRRNLPTKVRVFVDYLSARMGDGGG